MNRPKRVLLFGYYGFGNAGDEAVLAGLINSIQQQAIISGQMVEMAVLSINPQATTKDYGIKAFHRYRVSELINALTWCDLLAAGGGSLLQDVTSAHSIYYYLGVVRLAQLIGKKTIFVAQGIGPLNLPRSRSLTASVAKRCNAITVRDIDSSELLQEIGVNQDAIVVTADPALLLGISNNQSGDIDTIAISLRPWQNNASIVMCLATALQELKTPPSRILSIPCSEEDIPSLFEFDKLIGSKLEQPGTSMTYVQILTAMSSCQMMIGMRLHALILATACGIPCVALSYDPKVAAFMEQSGQQDAIYDIRENDHVKLNTIITQVGREISERRARISELLPSLRINANQNAVVALELLK